VISKDLKEKPWKDVLHLSDSQVEEELLLPMIEKFNKHPELYSAWTCCGDTLVAAQRHLIDGKQLPIFFICTIRKFIEAKEEIPVSANVNELENAEHTPTQV
jgi:hypothetical protein